MTAISIPLQEIRDSYDVVVIGSGYGGGIAASRLARAGKRVCLLERGREIRPGEYPDTELEAAGEFQIDGPKGHVGSRTALFDFRSNKDMNVLVGCGLGGTSLINANVALRADPRVFDDPCWPPELIADLATRVEHGYREAERMLRPTPYPDHMPELAKTRAHRKSAESAPGEFALTPINVNFEELPNDRNHVDVEQHPCTNCGDCVSGCNYSAKNTTLMNYLPDAWNHGAEIFCQASVRHIERSGDEWLVHFQALDSGREKFDAPALTVRAGVVVLGAGTLGTSEILLRSRDKGLTLSKQLGKRFTGNGDVLAFGYNNDETINGIGWGHLDPEDREPVGPCITSVIDSRNDTSLEVGMVLEEGTAPGAISAILPGALAAANALLGRDTDRGIADHVRETARKLDSLIRGAYHGAIRNTQIYLVMSHDDSGGRIKLENDRARVLWKNVGRLPIFKRANDALYKATQALGGSFVKNPVWTKLFDHDLVTVHPMGGAILASDANKGVVNHKGQVFSGTSGTDVYPGLYVGDGAMIPRSLGVNPLLTISAIAERNTRLLAEDRGWAFNYDLPSSRTLPVSERKPGVRFTEAMRGWFSRGEEQSYERGAELGEANGSPFEFVLTIASPDVEAMLEDPEHEAQMVGSVVAPALSPNPLAATEGVFNLFSPNPDQVGVRNMVYGMKLSADSGEHFYFAGFKVIHSDPGLDLWSDTTTLYITLYQGEDAEGTVIGKGILKILPADFQRQMTTMKITGVSDPIERLKWLARFGGFFGETLLDTYGGIFARPNVFDPSKGPRKRRPLRVTAPEYHPFTTSDNVELLLTRYQGGEKGPVMLSHGLGVSSRIFSIDTIDTNLLEYLFAHGYDVWLLDFRSSIELPASKTRHSGDDVATKDYPAAIEMITAKTGKEVQVVAHCFGATTFVMAMLAGLKGVRSAVISQIATYIEAPAITQIKSGLYVPTVLEKLGIDSLTAYVDTEANWFNKLYDKALGLLPADDEEECRSSCCHRVRFMYGLLYEHDQLNRATHNALHEMFGEANVESLQHLAILVRTGHLVDADGREVYMDNLDRLAIPIRFIHGLENACFRPISTQRTCDELKGRNGRSLYDRIEIPNYGHIDCIFGRNAVIDVYPKILEHLEKTA